MVPFGTLGQKQPLKQQLSTSSCAKSAACHISTVALCGPQPPPWSCSNAVGSPCRTPYLGPLTFRTQAGVLSAGQVTYVNNGVNFEYTGQLTRCQRCTLACLQRLGLCQSINHSRWQQSKQRGAVVRVHIQVKLRMRTNEPGRRQSDWTQALPQRTDQHTDDPARRWCRVITIKNQTRREHTTYMPARLLESATLLSCSQQEHTRPSGPAVNALTP